MSGIMRHHPLENPWLISEGDYLHSLLRKFESDPPRQEKARAEALRVVSKFASPVSETPISKSQLVLGQVQSGKTSNMINTMALAIDNKIPFIVVLTGVNRILDSQTSRDMRRQFQEAQLDIHFVDEAGKGAGGVLGTQDGAKQVLEAANDWRISGGQDGVPICVFLLKNATTMKNFLDVIEGLDLETRSLPVLIIDDEADQAGPDSGKEGQPSEINKCVARLRAAFGRHNYLLYTATPQAPLLAHLENALSPDVVTNLEAGEGYVGVQKLFPRETANPVFAIQLADADSAEFNPRELSNAPESLILALATFLVRTVVARRPEFGLKFGTMMVHTSQTQRPMEATARWIGHRLDDWRELFLPFTSEDTPKGVDPDARQEWDKYFAPAIEAVKSDLIAAKKSVDFDGFDFMNAVVNLIRQKRIEVLNAKTPNFQDDQWSLSPCWVLVGGEKLGRGFRVENLLVTYMPRTTKSGASTLDTVQQRGRFFGYRDKYISLLKGWFPASIIKTFVTYRDHEQDLREVLKDLETRGWPLKKWQRVLRTNDLTAPTRRAVIKMQVSRISFPPGDLGFSQRHPFDKASAKATREIVDDLLGRISDSELQSGNSVGTGGQLSRSRVYRCSFSEFEGFLIDYYEVIRGKDSFHLNYLVEHLAQLSTLETVRPNACFVFHEWNEGGEGLDRRGPLRGAEGFLEEETEISAFSRSNASDQVPVFFNDLQLNEFIIHVFRFDLYKTRVDASVSVEDLFDRDVPVIQIRVPRLDLEKFTRQQ